MTKYPEQSKLKGQSIYLAHSLSVQFITAGKSWQQGLKGADGERIASSVQFTSMDSVQDHSPCNSVTMGKVRLHTAVNLVSTSVSGVGNINCHRYLFSFHICHFISTFESWYRVLGGSWPSVSSLWVFSTFLWLVFMASAIPSVLYW